jgi:hypothetical protein
MQRPETWAVIRPHFADHPGFDGCSRDALGEIPDHLVSDTVGTSAADHVFGEKWVRVTACAEDDVNACGTRNPLNTFHGLGECLSAPALGR